MGFDKGENIPELSPEFIEKQFEIARTYEKIGVIPTFSCIPYEILPIPQEGTEVSFAESSAAVLTNSHLNIITNKESSIKCISQCINRKIPLFGFKD